MHASAADAVVLEYCQESVCARAEFGKTDTNFAKHFVPTSQTELSFPVGEDRLANGRVRAT